MTEAKPRALDLFCGAGGATKGLQRAGFHVTGVDIKPQPRYCGDAFIQGDALRPPVDLGRFDFIWASPPCQAYSSSWSPYEHPNLIPQVRAMLAASGSLTCIENVPGAPLTAPIVLDGTMFPALRVIRRRLFECNFPVPLLLGFDATGFIRRHQWVTVCGGGRCSGTPRAANAWHTNAHKNHAMGIDWMRRDELSQAVPPAYSEFIGRATLQNLRAAA
jgi:DNA (cytosine-5)-methyltransferase 1